MGLRQVRGKNATLLDEDLTPTGNCDTIDGVL
jgi:hypothetical protein